MQDSEAISRLKQGDLSGLESLVKKYQVKALRTAYLIVQDYDLAEDVVQDAFLRAYERINQYDAKRPFGPWFFRIVINIAKRIATQRERHIHLDAVSANAETAIDELLADLKSDPEVIVEQHDIHRTVWVALGRLSPMQRAVIIQRYYLDMSEKDIAAHSGVPLGTLKWRLHTAREQLRAWLSHLWLIGACNQHKEGD
ncbi:MAG: sigma-70 family RNA polymerase sigma factor [Oscillochloridaceae bacterium]|nr:sigma-70 family RNA polymerase sigma factor [Chloroflexaceae bacterium]MDW8389491.1 sigma-70 family RNA polymerase sigma factor [Oscillochloridaceae bacterium]